MEVATSNMEMTSQIEEAMLPRGNEDESGGSKCPVYLAAIAATLLTFCGASQTGWSSPALYKLDEKNSTLPLHPSSDEEQWISSLMTVGAVFGAIPAGALADCLGRKRSMLLLALPIFISWGMIYFAKEVLMLYAARLLGGIAFGALSTIVPIYVNEIAEDSVRGSLGTLFQIMMCSGIVYTYVVGAIASYYTMAVCCALLPVIFVIVFSFAPETPSYLLKCNRIADAEKSLQLLRGRGTNTSKELQALESEIKDSQSTTSKNSFLKALRYRETKLAIVISFGMMACQQLTGINVVIFYASTIFEAAGTKSISPQVLAIFVGLAQVIAALISIVLVERLGRKILLQISGISMAICLAVLGYFFFLKDRGDDIASIRFVPPIAVILYVLLFGIGFGPIPWLMSGEVLSDDVKGICTSVATSLNWGLAFVTTFTFKKIINAIGNAGTYWLLAVISILAFLFSTFVVIETKGKSIQQVQDELSGRKRRGNVN